MTPHWEIPDKEPPPKVDGTQDKPYILPGQAKLGKPTSVVIFGKTYKIEYVDNPAEVDNQKRQSLWGQIDYWTHTIRIYDNGRSIDGVFESLVHEVLHALDNELHLKIDDKSDHHEILTRLAGGLADTLVRNGRVKL